MRLVWLAMIAAACGGGGAGEAPPAPIARAIGTIAPAAGADDVIVARVAGRPVWGSCVAQQAARGGAKVDARRAALDECIAFELMAQEAERRGMVATTSADDEVKRALVSRLVEVAFEATHTTPESLGEVMTRWLATNAWRMHRPELRASSYARVVVDKDAPPETEARAKAIAETLASALAAETGLFGVNLRETANRIGAGAGLKIESADSAPMQRTKLDPSYGDALFALPEVGRASPPIRTPWGWDVIVWTGGLPAQEQTREQLAADAFVELRRVAFGVWVNALIKELGVKVTIDPAQVAKLEGGSS